MDDRLILLSLSLFASAAWHFFDVVRSTHEIRTGFEGEGGRLSGISLLLLILSTNIFNVPVWPFLLVCVVSTFGAINAAIYNHMSKKEREQIHSDRTDRFRLNDLYKK